MMIINRSTSRRLRMVEETAAGAAADLASTLDGD